MRFLKPLALSGGGSLLVVARFENSSFLLPTILSSPMVRSLTSLLICSLLALFIAAPSHAQTEGIGIGASLGVTNGAQFDQNPVGVNGKLWLSDRQAIAGMTSFFIGDAGTVAGPSFWILQGDYLFHNFNELEVGEGLLALFLGAGAQLTVLEANDNQFALRSPTGITYLLGSAPVDVFVEVAPALSITDPVTLRFDGAIGFRYYFPFGDETDATQ